MYIFSLTEASFEGWGQEEIKETQPQSFYWQIPMKGKNTFKECYLMEKQTNILWNK